VRWRLWGLAFLTFGLGDAGLTIYGLAHGASELNPTAAAIIAGYGILGIIGLKLVVFAFFGLLAWGVPRAWTNCPEGVWRTGLPLAVALMGLVPVVWNLAALATQMVV